MFEKCFLNFHKIYINFNDNFLENTFIKYCIKIDVRIAEINKK